MGDMKLFHKCKLMTMNQKQCIEATAVLAGCTELSVLLLLLLLFNSRFSRISQFLPWVLHLQLFSKRTSRISAVEFFPSRLQPLLLKL